MRLGAEVDVEAFTDVEMSDSREKPLIEVSESVGADEITVGVDCSD